MFIEVRIALNDNNSEAVQGILYLHGVDCWELSSQNLLSDIAPGWDYLDRSLLQKTEPDYLKFFLPDDDEGKWVLKLLREEYGYQVTESFADPSAWENEWKKFYKPLEIGGRLVIKPQWEEYAGSCETVCVLDPGNVFGTGLHQTTQLCLEALVKHVHGGEHVLDVGSGSGILGISALLLGAADATLTEIDPSAPAVVRRNLELNALTAERCQLYKGDILTDSELLARISTECYELITANIVADIIMRLSPTVKELIAEDGLFIASGLVDERIDEVRASLLRDGWKIVEQNSKDNWHCLVCVL